MEYHGKNNLTGTTFNKLKVISYEGNSYWKCQCECGNLTTVRTSSLKNGKTKSCGCLRGQNTKGNIRKSAPKEDLTGKRFYRLTVLKYIKGGFWECQCDCGKITQVDTRNLNSGHTKSCGCLVKTVLSTNNTLDMIGFENNYLKVLSRAGSTINGLALWECLCKRCGNTFITTGSRIRREEVCSCGCLQSKNESVIAALLREHNITFVQQYSFPDLDGVGGRKLRFDFAIFNGNELSHLIEYNGMQHYIKPDGDWGDNYEITITHDRLKKEYCEKKNIPLITISYEDDYDINTLLI